MPKSKKTVKVKDQAPAQDPKGGRGHGVPRQHPNSGGGKETQRLRFLRR